MMLGLVRPILAMAFPIALVTTEVAAQNIAGGLLSSVNVASLAHADGPLDSRVGLRVGGFLEFDLPSSLALRAEVAYAMKGAKPDGPPAVALDYVELPLLVTVTVRRGRLAPVVFAGPALGVKVKARLGSLEYGDLVHRWDPSLVLGGGIEVPVGGKAVLLEARYTRGVNPMYDFGDPSDTDSDDKNQTVSVGAAIRLF